MKVLSNGLAERERRREEQSYALGPELLHWGVLVRLTCACYGAQTEWLTFIGMAVASALLPLMMSVFVMSLVPAHAQPRLDALADAFERLVCEQVSAGSVERQEGLNLLNI